MNTLPNSMTIAFLAVSILHAVFTVDFAIAQNTVAGPTAARPTVDPTLSPYLKFDRLTSEDGLSNDTIWGIAQDNQGFMWFGTFDGLNRYDGYDFKLQARPG